jgi:protein gp37
LNGLPRLVFVDDLGDAFSESLPLDWMAEWLPQMGQAPHNWLILTKRPSRALRFSQKHPFPPNVWVGTSVTSKKVLKRVDYLRRIEATVRFISAEPLLGPLDSLNLDGIHQVIVGGESGPNFRPMDNLWARDIRDKCVAAGAAFYYKQSASMKSGVQPFIIERDGSRWAWHQVPGKMLAPYLYTPHHLPVL